MTDTQEEKTEIMRAFAWRLNSAAEAKGLQQVDIAEKLGVKPPRVRNWFQGLNYPRKAERLALIKILEVPREWLFKETTDKDSYSPATLREPSSPYGISVREVPVISWTHAGQASTFEEMPKLWQGHVASTSRDPRAFGVVVEGDCMEPKYLAGDILIVEPSNERRSGKPVVAKLVDDAVQVRIYTKLPGSKILLASMKPAIYPTIEYTLKDFHWIWPVHQMVRNE